MSNGQIKFFLSFASPDISSDIDHDIQLQVASPFGGSCKLLPERDHYSAVMATRETIQIPSSESDSDSESWNLDDVKRVLNESPLMDSASSNHRILPPWNSVGGTNSIGKDKCVLN